MVFPYASNEFFVNRTGVYDKEKERLKLLQIQRQQQATNSGMTARVDEERTFRVSFRNFRAHLDAAVCPNFDLPKHSYMYLVVTLDNGKTFTGATIRSTTEPLWAVEISFAFRTQAGETQLMSQYVRTEIRTCPSPKETDEWVLLGFTKLDMHSMLTGPANHNLELIYSTEQAAIERKEEPIVNPGLIIKKSGELYRQGNTFKIWRKRYYRLDLEDGEYVFDAFEDEDMTDFVRTIPLTSILSVEGIPSSGGKEHCFRLTIDGEKHALLLSAATAKEREQWLMLLTEARLSSNSSHRPEPEAEPGSAAVSPSHTPAVVQSHAVGCLVFLSEAQHVADFEISLRNVCCFLSSEEEGSFVLEYQYTGDKKSVILAPAASPSHGGMQLHWAELPACTFTAAIADVLNESLLLRIREPHSLTPLVSATVSFQTCHLESTHAYRFCESLISPMTGMALGDIVGCISLAHASLMVQMGGGVHSQNGISCARPLLPDCPLPQTARVGPQSFPQYSVLRKFSSHFEMRLCNFTLHFKELPFQLAPELHFLGGYYRQCGICVKEALTYCLRIGVRQKVVAATDDFTRPIHKLAISEFAEEIDKVQTEVEKFLPFLAGRWATEGSACDGDYPNAALTVMTEVHDLYKTEVQDCFALIEEIDLGELAKILSTLIATEDKLIDHIVEAGGEGFMARIPWVKMCHKYLEEWMAETAYSFDVCFHRCLENEHWTGVDSATRVSTSVVDIFSMFAQTTSTFFKLPIPFSSDVVQQMAGNINKMVTKYVVALTPGGGGIQIEHAGVGHCGWMWMRTGFLIKSWHRYWFKMDESSLFYMHNSNDSKAQGMVQLVPNATVDITEVKEKANVVRLAYGTTLYLFACESEESQEEWMRVILQAINHVRLIMEPQEEGGVTRTSKTTPRPSATVASPPPPPAAHTDKKATGAGLRSSFTVTSAHNSLKAASTPMRASYGAPGTRQSQQDDEDVDDMDRLCVRYNNANFALDTVRQLETQIKKYWDISVSRFGHHGLHARAAGHSKADSDEDSDDDDEESFLMGLFSQSSSHLKLSLTILVDRICERIVADELFELFEDVWTSEQHPLMPAFREVVDNAMECLRSDLVVQGRLSDIASGLHVATLKHLVVVAKNGTADSAEFTRMVAVDMHALSLYFSGDEFTDDAGVSSLAIRHRRDARKCEADLQAVVPYQDEDLSALEARVRQSVGDPQQRAEAAEAVSELRECMSTPGLRSSGSEDPLNTNTKAKPKFFQRRLSRRTAFVDEPAQTTPGRKRRSFFFKSRAQKELETTQSTQ